ncbi:MAG TPA: sensor histidine kinase KdpD [Terriglobales bacterium]|nr:sensor histidine kinase KdpD [Terriglobales bacterium]
MNDQRPDPDELLRRVREQEERERRAQLKIFLGACAGVGKTYAMLVEAHERRRAGIDAVIGVAETHGRAETEALLEGLEILPTREIEYRGTVLREFDPDVALARRPGLLLLDELAHTNVPGSRHAKRWLDVEELLDAGIDVYTTLNVQHVESLYDVVAQITGIVVREVVPDSILERADEIELVDLPPDDLLQRMREGKVYMPELAGRAMENFFRKGNLIALRELALRVTADRVDQQMESYRRDHAIRESWPVGGRILVGIGEPLAGVRLVRAVSRMAARLQADWIVAHVETPGEFGPSDSTRDHIVDLLGYAEELGAETAMLGGTRPADELLAYARERNVSRIVVGKPTRAPWLRALRGSLVDALVRGSGDIDVYIMSGEIDEEAERGALLLGRETPSLRAANYLRSAAAVALANVVAWLLYSQLSPANLIMIYLLAVLAVAARLGRGPAILASILSVATFDFFFVPPRLALRVSDTQYLLTFVVMLAVALVISTMASRLRQQAEAARRRERRAASLFHLSRELSSLRGIDELLSAAVQRVQDDFGARAFVLLPDASGNVMTPRGQAPPPESGGHDLGVAQWSFDHGQPAGPGTPTLPAAGALFVPLHGSGGPIGVIGIASSRSGALSRDQLRLLESFADQVGLNLERVQLAAQAERARVLIESERMRSTLLSSVSHDLRTPLSAILGAASSLMTGESTISEPVRRELIETIGEESQRLNRLVGNLLDMTRLESGATPLKREWHSLEEVIGAALARLEPRLAGREVGVRLPPELPLVELDGVLIGQVLFNLLENAVKYTPAGAPIEVRAALEDGALQLEVADRGPGLPEGEEERVFEKFYRGRREGEPSGVGLGLSICRGIVEAHGGRIVARNREGGGSVFRVTLPQEGKPPSVLPENESSPASASGAPPR